MRYLRAVALTVLFALIAGALVARAASEFERMREAQREAAESAAGATALARGEQGTYYIPDRGQ